LLTSGLLDPRAAAAVSFVDASAGLPVSNSQLSCNPFPDGGWSGVQFADLNGDGLEDLGAVGRLQLGLHCYQSDGTGNWSEHSAGLDPGCHGRSDVGFADVNRDGLLDLGGIAWINGHPQVFLGDGGASWLEASSGLSGSGGEGFCFGDFDGDGNPDVATTGHLGTGGARVFLGDGTGAWLDASAGLPIDGGGHKLTAADLDLDGRDELITTLRGGSEPDFDGLSIWKLDPDGLWSRVYHHYVDQAWGVDVGDVNNDGLPDIALGLFQADVGGFGSLRVLINTDPGFEESSTGLPVEDDAYTDVALGDLNNDGNLDLVAGSYSGDTRIFMGDGLGLWTEALGTGLPAATGKTEGLDVGDLDGDCRLDIAIAAYDAGLHVYRETDPGLCPVLPEAGAGMTVCGGDEVRLDASQSRVCGCVVGEVIYRWWADGSPLGDWSADPTLTAVPEVTTLYRVEVACSSDPGCARADAVLVSVIPSVTPGPVGNSFVLLREDRDVRASWEKLLPLDSSGDYEIVWLGHDPLLPPSTANMDALAAVLATAPNDGVSPGGESLLPDAVNLTPALVYFRVRGTNACSGAPGSTGLR
jgi:hypothetical protein